MPSSHLILCCPLLLLPVFPSIFFIELAIHIRWPKYWSFSFHINSSNEYSRLISYRIDCFDLLAVQVTLKSLLQHHSLKASILQCSAFFMVPLSHPHMSNGKTMALTIQTFVGKVLSLLFNALSGFAIAFLSRRKHLFNFVAAVTVHSDFGAQENKVCHCFHFSPIYLPQSDGTGCHVQTKSFSFSSSTFIKRLFSSPLLFAITVVSSAYLRLLIFLLAILYIRSEFYQDN